MNIAHIVQEFRTHATTMVGIIAGAVALIIALVVGLGATQATKPAPSNVDLVSELAAEDRLSDSQLEEVDFERFNSNLQNNYDALGGADIPFSFESDSLNPTWSDTDWKAMGYGCFDENNDGFPDICLDPPYMAFVKPSAEEITEHSTSLKETTQKRLELEGYTINPDIGDELREEFTQSQLEVSETLIVKNHPYGSLEFTTIKELDSLRKLAAQIKETGFTSEHPETRTRGEAAVEIVYFKDKLSVVILKKDR